ncbi:MAG TPA: hypothetical protein VKU19_21555 [Bryobacteraceae bacterium]|nr:hypothetical protein [Bryobacteraceae bacterium]
MNAIARCSKLARLGLLLPVVISLVALASDQRPSSEPKEENVVRSLISHWIEAYKALDAKRLAALETPDVQVVDRFGVLHVSSGRSDNEKLWSDSFEAVAKNAAPPIITIKGIRFLRPDLAVVQASGGLQTESCLSMEIASRRFHKPTRL